MPDTLCCGITNGLTTSTTCTTAAGGIDELLIGCRKFFSFTEGDCSTPATSYISAIVAEDPITTLPVTPLYTISFKRKTAENVFGMEYDDETGTVNRTGGINFQTQIDDPSLICFIEETIGQEVVIFFKPRGTSRWFIEGRCGDLFVTSFAGGTGTDAANPTQVTIAGTELACLVGEYFNTDVATTEADVVALTN